MGKTKKNKARIIQRIKHKNWKQKIRRIRKKHRKIIQFQIQSKVIALPRKFRRYRKKGNGISQNQNLVSSVKRYYFLDKHLPPNLNYLVKTKESPFSLDLIKKENFNTKGIVIIPKVFSIIEKPEEGYKTIKEVISGLLLENNEVLILNYENCEKIELSSQVLLDIILKDFLVFRNKCSNIDRNHKDYFPNRIAGVHIVNEEVRKLMFSVGSPVTLKVKEYKFKDIIPYKLCIHDNEKEKNIDRRIEQKELDTTEMADYVIDCLARMNKKLTSTKRDDLCTVIGETLINAEEHSTTKYRFSIGYFKEDNVDNKHYGIFRLVILNFGKTIYEKFKTDDCPNQEIVTKMKTLSKSYTRRNLFFQRKFEEDNLWTLYALQEGVSSVSTTDNQRGNGSIRFIDSFFNIKGTQTVDNISYLKIQSGRTRIHFNGEYGIVSKTNLENETFKVMTFNTSGDIEEMPDNKYVYQTNYYFPGTIISAKLLLNDDDIEQLN